MSKYKGFFKQTTAVDEERNTDTQTIARKALNFYKTAIKIKTYSKTEFDI